MIELAGCPPHRRVLSKKFGRFHQVTDSTIIRLNHLTKINTLGRIKAKQNAKGNLQPKKINPVKYFLLPILIVVAVVVIFYGLEILNQVEIEPSALYVYDIRGGPNVGNYTVLFALEDQKGNVGPADGYVYFKIFSSNDSLLYTTSFRVRSNEFLYHTDPVHGYRVLSYSWVIPSSDVTPIPVSDNSSGHAELTFLSMAGYSVSGSFQGLELPHYPQ